MNKFDEYAFVSGLCEREQDARDIKKLFDPEWLTDAELRPVLRAVYDFMGQHDTVPSISALSQFMEDKDQDKFNSRWRTTIEQLKGYDNKKQMMNIKMAREAAASYALHHLIHEQRFQKMLAEGKADALRSEVSIWLTKHTESNDEGLFSIQEAFDKMVDDHPWQGRQSKISTGIYPIDRWSGGIRAPQMGIIMAPTGHGKSVLLMNIAWQAAAIEGKNVLFITNELTVNEQAERFAVRMQRPKIDPITGKQKFLSMSEVQDDPSIVYKKLHGYQQLLAEKLFIYSANLGQTIDGIDEVMKRMRNERGVWPDVVVVDYLERMETKVKMDRGATWTYYGQIGKELVWLAKRRGCVVWTAIQTNRSGMNTKADISMENAQGSIQHFQEASLAIGARKVQVTDASGQQKTGMEFTEMKARHGAMEGRKMIVECDLSRMVVSNIEIEGVKDIETVTDQQTPNNGKKAKIMGQYRAKGK